MSVTRKKKRHEVKSIRENDQKVQVNRKEDSTSETIIRVGHLKNKVYNVKSKKSGP